MSDNEPPVDNVSVDDWSDSNDCMFITPPEIEDDSLSSSESVTVDEEAIDRYQLEIEDAVAQYETEPRIRHSVCPDSDSDSEGEDVPIVHVNRTHQIERRHSGALYLHKAYSSGVAFKENGLINAVKKEIPKAEHRKCVRHIYQNIKAKHGRKMEVKPFIWQLAWSYNETQYKINLARLKEYDEDVYNDVQTREPETWCLTFYKIEGNCCEDVENNSVESFNNTIVTPREKPVMPMLEMIRRLAMVRINTRSAIAKKHQAMFTPYVKEVLDLELDDAKKSRVYPGSTGIYEVEIGYVYESVNMLKRECTCCKRQITGIPCAHAYGVILYTNADTDNYVADWFLTSRWRDAYEHAPFPVRGPDSWIRGDFALVTEDPERNKKNIKEKRKKSKNESPSKKKKRKTMDTDSAIESQDKPKRVMHCKKCGGPSHNKRTCSKSSKRDHGGECSTQPLSQVYDS